VFHGRMAPSGMEDRRLGDSANWRLALPHELGDVLCGYRWYCGIYGDDVLWHIAARRSKDIISCPARYSAYCRNTSVEDAPADEVLGEI